MATRRQQLIRQMRRNLHLLTSPSYDDYHDQIEFDIADTTFNFTREQLEEERNEYGTD